jgi:hypothetical protein
LGFFSDLLGPSSVKPDGAPSGRALATSLCVVLCFASAAHAADVSAVVAADRYCTLLVSLVIIVVDLWALAVVVGLSAGRTLLFGLFVSWWPVVISQIVLVFSLRWGVLPLLHDYFIIPQLGWLTVVFLTAWLVIILGVRALALWGFTWRTAVPRRKLGMALIAGPLVWLLISSFVYAASPVRTSLLSELTVTSEADTRSLLRGAQVYFLRRDGVYLLQESGVSQVLACAVQWGDLRFEQRDSGAIDLILTRGNAIPEVVVVPSIAKRVLKVRAPSNLWSDPEQRHASGLLLSSSESGLTISQVSEGKRVAILVQFDFPLVSSALRNRNHLHGHTHTPLRDGVILFGLGEDVAIMDFPRRTIGRLVDGSSPCVVLDGAAIESHLYGVMLAEFVAELDEVSPPSR